jgi:hypothetical protein
MSLSRSGTAKYKTRPLPTSEVPLLLRKQRTCIQFVAID